MDKQHRDAVTRRVRALLNKTVANGCTEDEAIAAAEKARAMMDQHRLTMSDIEFKSEPMVDKTFDRKLKKKTSPTDYCLKGIEKYCGVRMWRMTDYVGIMRCRVLGLRDDADFAEYLYNMIDSAIWGGVDHWYYKEEKLQHSRLTQTEKRHAVWSYELGMATRINERLIAMAAALEPVAKTSDGTALVLVRNPLVDEAFAKLGIRFGRRSKGMSMHDYAAHAAGQAAGDRVNLNRPVGGTGASKRLH